VTSPDPRVPLARYRSAQIPGAAPRGTRTSPAGLRRAARRAGIASR